MIPKMTISRCARSIVASMNLRRGDAVFIRGGTHAQQLLEDIAYECYRVGALPLITSQSDEFSSRVMRGIPSSTLEQVPPHMVGVYEKIDCLIKIETYEDPVTPTGFPRSKLEATTKAAGPLRKILYGEENGVGKKWCYAVWPTKKAAEFFGVDYELYEKFIIEGMNVSSSALVKRCEAIKELLNGASRVHVTDPEGTDYELKIQGRRRYLDDGFVSDEDVQVNDKGNNLPAGEVFMPPHETYGSGTIFCPLTRDKFSGKILRDVELHFDNGKLDLYRVKASENRDSLIKSFKQAMRVDKKTVKKLRTLNVAELGIGCNPKINKAIGYILTDEKIIGSTHVGFGGNSIFGGKSRSAIHWDFVTIPKATMIASIEGEGERTVIKNGKLQKR